ncbi:MAG: glycosyltransferase family 4 protein [Methanosarcinales archaeon]|nr:glycosyltransferase family 4 protein [Methanosarcinales archaeon]
MKIAYLYDAVYPWVKGGAEARIYQLSRRLQARGHQVHIYGMKWWPGEAVREMDGVTLHGICPPVDLYVHGRRSVREALYFAGKVLTSLEGGYDVIDCQEFPYLPCFPARLRAGMGGSELVVTWHEVWGDYWYRYLGRWGMLGKAAELCLSRLCRNNVAVSSRTCQHLVALGAREVEVIPNGIDRREIEEVVASDEQCDVIYIGRLAENKNLDLLMRSLSLVRQEVPDLRCTIIGDGPEMAKLKRLCRELGVDRSVQFKGFLESHGQVLTHIKSSRMLVLPSTREGFGMAALEACACGLPVVTVNHWMNAACDLITPRTGIVCQPEERDLAAGIVQLLATGKGMRESCLELARGYDWDRIADRCEEYYRRAAQG